MNFNFLPMSLEEAKQKGWDELDVILITGDEYVDHHTNGTAVIGRYLEKNGFKVGIISQPNWTSDEDFCKLGAPKLFFGINSGAIDSMLCNYTSSKKPRKSLAGKKPDRALIVYTNKIKKNFKNIPIVIGGLEASMRRMAHYDYWQDTVRRSILVDSKADILVYGMGEKQILEIARRLESGENIYSIDDIPGTVTLKNKPQDLESIKNKHFLPPYEIVKSDKKIFNVFFKTIYENQIPNRHCSQVLVQETENRFVICNPPRPSASSDEIDEIFELPYQNTWHPFYDTVGGVKDFESVKFSVISNVGCVGECYFCSIYMHQGRIVQSRSKTSIIREITKLTQMKDFRGTITDVGGPCANLFLAKCEKWKDNNFCKTRSCLIPEKCENLKLGYDDCIKLYEQIKNLPQIKHVFIQSGLRYDLLFQDEKSQKYLEYICKNNIGGRIKLAPENTDDEILRLMNKPSFKIYKEFSKVFEKIVEKIGKKIFIVNYFITSYPGTSLHKALDFGLFFANQKIHPEQIQDFIPLPMTVASCMFYTGFHPFTGEKISVPKTFEERNIARAFVQYKNLESKKLVKLGLKKLNKLGFLKKFGIRN